MFPPGVDVQCKLHLTTDIAFRDIQGPKVHGVISTLQQMSDLTNGIINILERTFYPPS
jgi:hypothetical protein